MSARAEFRCTGTERASAAVLTGLPAWLRDGADGCVISVHAQPGAKHTAVAGLHGEALKIRLAAPPVDGKANAELLRFVAERLGVARSAITLLAGDASRAKRLRVVGASAAQIVARLVE